MQSEEREHDVLLGNVDYQIKFNSGNSSFIAYLAAQKTNRSHYTGIRPEVGTDEDVLHLEDPPYGTSFNSTKQAGLQINHKSTRFLGSNVFTFGSEAVSDHVVDEISSYKYLINQKVVNQAVFFQSDWNLTDRFNLLSGARFDKHSLLNDIIISPRMSILYKVKKQMQLRVSYSTGFRAPQAFDADLHIAFAGGGISRIILADNLKQERSNSVSASINYDKATHNYIYGFTFEGFHTHLQDAFYLDLSGSDLLGDIFIKRNGAGATVKGLTVELRANFNQKIQIESGFTLQSSLYSDAVRYSDSLQARREFLRSPNQYGYATLSYDLNDKVDFSANLVHTGVMHLIHFSGSPDQLTDEFYISPVFNVFSLKSSYSHSVKRGGFEVKYSLGVKNLNNSFQQQFDSFKNRDSNFIFGPNLPRTFFLGVLLRSI